MGHIDLMVVCPVAFLEEHMTYHILNDAALPKSWGEAKISTVNTIPIESAALIENVLLGENESLVDVVYNDRPLRVYFKEHGIELLEFGGGEFGITANAMLQVPETVIADLKFSNGRKLGRTRAKEIHARCLEAMRAEPYY